MIFPTQIFNPGSIPSIQEMLLTLSEYITETITTTSVNTQQYIFVAIQQTLFNSLDIINAYQIQSLMAQEYSLLTNVSGALPNLSPADQVLINSRLAGLAAMLATIYPLVTNLVFDVNQINNGLPALQAYDLTSYMVQFNYEIPPVGLTLGNFLTNAQAMANAWFDLVTYLAASGTTFQLSGYNSAERMAYCSQDTENLVSNLIFSPSITNVTQMWNSLIALPSMLRVAGLLYNDPSSEASQIINIIKFVIYNLIYQTNAILAAFNAPTIVEQPVQAILRVGESLLDFATRTLGDYTQWTAVATANGLIPPYVGTISAPGIAVPGQKLFLPPFSINSQLGSYGDAYLGTDIDLGPPYTELETWSGDFALVRGLPNYVGALARRVLTPTGTLIYHPTYGSGLPARIGNVSTANEAFLESSLLKNALLADPRTQVVNQITAYPVAFGQIVMTALVTPYGAAAPVPFNLVIIPQSNKQQ